MSVRRTLLALAAATALVGVSAGPAAAAGTDPSDIPNPGPGYRLLSA